MLNQLDEDPKNMELRFEIVEYCFANELNEESIQHCINVINISN